MKAIETLNAEDQTALKVVLEPIFYDLLGADLATRVPALAAPFVEAADSAAQRSETAGEAAESANEDVQLAAAQIASDKAAVGVDRAAVAADRVTAQGLVVQAQAISFANVQDPNGNISIGTGTIAGGSGHTYLNGAGPNSSSKGFFSGGGSGRNSDGYSVNATGFFTWARGIGDYSAWYATHAGQDANQAGRWVPGFGARATRPVSFVAVPEDGDTLVLNGVALTARSAPASAYEFARGASAAEAAYNCLVAVLGLTDTAILEGWYRLDAVGGTTLHVASSSFGTYGNGFTLAATGSAITVPGPTLTGGTEAYNTGNPASTPGDVGVGWSAGMDLDRPPLGRKSTASIVFSANAEEGAAMLLGFNLMTANTATFKAAPSAALDIQIGASREATLANTTALLNGSANTTINTVTYWAQNGLLILETDAVANNTFEVRVRGSVALTASTTRTRGGSTAFGSPSFIAGFNSGVSVTGAGHVIIGGGTRTFGFNNTLINSPAMNGSNDIAIGYTPSYWVGDYNINIGSGGKSGAVGSWMAVQAITADGVITFASPHGLRQGSAYVCQYRDRTAGTTRIQIVPGAQIGSPGAPVSLSTLLAGISVRVINARQVRIEQASGPDTGGRDDGYQVSAGGTVANLDVAAAMLARDYSINIGHEVSSASYRITLGSRYYTEGLQIDAMGLNLTAGELRLRLVIPGTFATGSIQFATAGGNFADGDTVTLAGTAFTAKTGANMAAANSSMARWFRIGADMWDSLNNLLACIRNSDDQTAAARAPNRARFWINAVTGVGWFLRMQLLDTSSAVYTVATSKAGATATAPTGGTLGNLATAASTYPPKDKGLVMLTSSPAANGNSGPAQYDLATDSWRALRVA